MAGAFGVIHTWPEMKNAEYEVLQRILGAAGNIGARAAVIDRNGLVLWAHPELDLTEGKVLPRGSVDFVLSMHFESGRVLDFYSYYALWQAIDFYHVFGYAKSIDKLTSYNDLLSCASDVADAHGINLLHGLGRPPPLPLPQMFHALPEPYLDPQTDENSKLFYIGINWERIGRQTGRFHKTLVALDRQGLTKIYGPDTFLGVRVWEGFDTYEGELPFDGVSVKKAINDAGICLALSSASHKQSGIMTNRLFEGLAGGAAVIATPNALIDKFFGEAVILVDDSRGEDVLGQQIVAAVRDIRANPGAARRRTRRGQEIMREKCSLEGSLKALFEHTSARQAHFEHVALADAEVTVVLTCLGIAADEVEEHLEQFTRQKRARVTVRIVCTDRFARQHAARLARAAGGTLMEVTCEPAGPEPVPATFDGPVPLPTRIGPAVARVLNGVKTPMLAFFGIDDCVFDDHFASMARALADQPSAMAACSGMVVHTEAVTGADTRELDSIRFTDLRSILLAEGEGQSGRFAYRAALLDRDWNHVMALLDGQEERYFRLAGFLAGPLAQTSYATYVSRRTARLPRPLAEPVAHQQQYVRDAFARDPRWLRAMAELSVSAELRRPAWAQELRTPHNVLQTIPLDARLDVGAAGPGQRFLAGGFAAPEADHVWMLDKPGELLFTLPGTEPGRYEDYTLVLDVNARRSAETGRLQHVTVGVNGLVVGYYPIPDDPVRLSIALPVSRMRGVLAFHVQLYPDHAEAVYRPDGTLMDGRPLSLCLRSFAVLRTGQGTEAKLAAGVMHSCLAGAPGTAALLGGFYAPEYNVTWISGTRGTMRWQVPDMPRRPRLTLRLYGRKSRETGELPQLTATLNGTELGTFPIAEDPMDLDLDLDKIKMEGGIMHLTLVLSHAEAVFDDAHTVVDGRFLGVGLLGFGVFDAAKDRQSGGAAA